MRNEGTLVAKRISQQNLKAIEEAVGERSGGATARQIADALNAHIPLRTLQYRLSHLVNAGRLAKKGRGRWTKYHLPAMKGRAALVAGPTQVEGEFEASLPLSGSSAEIRDYLRQPPAARKPAGYDRGFLDSYRPNVSFYLSETERAHLAQVGRLNFRSQPAGTYSKKIFDRLLIDLAWNSSRLEGNTYSLIDTRRLIEFGEEAEGRDRLEAQMILNHKDAIAFLIGAADDVGFNRYTLLNLHAILANNLLPEEAAAGRLRDIAVGIEKSTFHPLEVPQLIEECFDQILATAAAIEDPFEQAFFVMVQMPYLQPFDDVNKRVSRLAANIPFIKGNLSPLSFTEVPRTTYTDAVLGVYELNKVDLLKDVFIWAYERSAARYAAVRQSLGEPDSFRLQHRATLRQIVGTVVRERMDRKAAVAHIASWTQENIALAEREKFREVAESELLGLHEGNFARYQFRPAEFAAWQEVWTGSAAE
ncbi:MAG: Fic family protein [Alphaproteobacteria bacterium]